MRAKMALMLHLGGVGEGRRLIWDWSVQAQESGDLQWMNPSEVNISLNHDVMSFIFTPPVTLNPQIWGQLGLCSSIRMHPYALETA